jgi:hexosaminidase
MKILQKKTTWAVALCLAAAMAPAAGAQAQKPEAELHLIPAPRKVKRQAGQFTLTRRTRIVLMRAHAAEERVAAEMLAEDIERLSGTRPRITTARSLPRGRGIIYLGRPERDRRLDEQLAADGLRLNAGFSEQGYALAAGPEQIVVAAQSDQGVFYGVQTLRQLLAPDAQGQIECPAVAIRDWPAMKWRGMQDDLSRGPIPTLDYMKRQIRTLSEYKINLFALYMENVFDFRSEPLVAPKRAALTPAEVKELVGYARRYYVTILPEQESFGHLHKLLREEIYSKLAETPHGGVLTPTSPQSFALIGNMVRELAPLFPGPFFHIGADETSELGEGRTKQLAAQEGLGQVYLDYLKRIDAILRPYHKRVMFWGDIAMNYPQLLDTLPKDMIAVAWDYSTRDSFDALLAPYKNAGLQTFVSPGANNWKRIVPDLDAAMVNIRNFVRDGQKFGSLGVLNTTWNDGGESLLDMTWPALVFGAACGWQPGESSIEQFWKDYDWAFYRHTDHGLSQAIQALAGANGRFADVGMGSASDQDFWLDPFSRGGAQMARETIEFAHPLRLDAERALVTIYRERGKARLHQGTLDDLIFAGKRLDVLGMKIQYTAEVGGLYWDAYQHMGDQARANRDLYRISATNGRLQDLRDLTTRLRNDYAQLWRRQYQPFWLDNVLIRYDNLAGLYQSKIQAVDAVLQNYHRTSELPPPETLGFVFRPPASGRR